MLNYLASSVESDDHILPKKLKIHKCYSVFRVQENPFQEVECKCRIHKNNVYLALAYVIEILILCLKPLYIIQNVKCSITICNVYARVLDTYTRNLQPGGGKEDF